MISAEFANQRVEDSGRPNYNFGRMLKKGRALGDWFNQSWTKKIKGKWWVNLNAIQLCWRIERKSNLYNRNGGKKKSKVSDRYKFVSTFWAIDKSKSNRNLYRGCFGPPWSPPTLAQEGGGSIHLMIRADFDRRWYGRFYLDQTSRITSRLYNPVLIYLKQNHFGLKRKCKNTIKLLQFNIWSESLSIE